MYNQSGLDGTIKAGNCPPGYGGWKCAPCEAGTVNADGLDQCQKCAPGKYSPEGIQTQCHSCERGQYQPEDGKSKCRKCQPGTFSNTEKATKCDACQGKPESNAVYYKPGSKKVKCSFRCLPGFAGFDCQACDSLQESDKNLFIQEDYFSNHTCSGQGRCIGDGKDPRMVQDCKELCQGCICNDAHHVPPFCITVLARILVTVRIYGLFGFVAAAFIIPTLAFCFLCRLKGCPGYRRNRKKEASEASQSLIDLQNLSKGSNPPVSSLGESASAHIESHVTRVYFTGQNTVLSPLNLPKTPPVHIAEMVEVEEYADFAREVNNKMAFTRKHQIVFFVMYSFCYPFAEHLLSRWRIKKLTELREIWANFPSSVFLLRLKIGMTIGVSPDGTLAYLDVRRTQLRNTNHLESTASTAVHRTSLGGRVSWSREELFLVLSGSGTYYNPFFLDPNDLLVKTIPNIPHLNKFIESLWHEFVRELNQALRVVDVTNLRGTLHSAMQCVEAYKSRASAGDFGGLQFELALVRDRSLRDPRHRRSTKLESFQSLSMLGSLSAGTASTPDSSGDCGGAIFINEKNLRDLQSYRSGLDR